MKHNYQKTVYGLAVLLISILACNAPTATTVAPKEIFTEQVLPTHTDAPPPTPTDTQTPDVPQRIEITPVNIEDAYLDSSTSSDQGLVIFHDPLSDQIFIVKVVDANTSAPIPNIELTLVSNGPEQLIFADDTTYSYMPAVKEYAINDIASNPQGEREILISLTPHEEITRDFWGWWALNQEIPNLDSWDFPTQEICIPHGDVDVDIESVDDLLLLPPSEDSFEKYYQDAIAAYLNSLGSQSENDQFVIQIDEENLTNRPSIVRWRVYRIDESGLPLAAKPVGWCLEPLDRTQESSVISWVNYGIENQNMFVFSTLAPDDVMYAIYIEGGQMNTREEYLEDLGERITSAPICNGVSTWDHQIRVWTSGWSPEWILEEMCYVECTPYDPPWESDVAAFLLHRIGEDWVLNTMWLNDLASWEDWNGPEEMSRCDEPDTPSKELTLTPPPKDVPPPTKTPPAFECPGARPPRLLVGGFAYVSPTPPLANRVRSGPGRDFDVIGSLQPGEAMHVLDGPACANGWLWWKVEALDQDLTGWTAEGDSDNYWLVPCASENECIP
jgi:hypothetical protein